jgi:hypothetical protein
MMTVRQAVAAPSGSTVSVRGHLIATAGETLLAEMLAESYPPQPGGATLRLEGVDLATLDDVEQVGDTAWTAHQRTLSGRIEDGVLHVE